ncbi:MAG: 3-isopropylmalate dehydratase small subunit [Gemmatimonadetes bacterium]|nr:3-isopropylmalate dehydratase small subunit [Gemmatimonadota bacterium]
MEVSASSVRAVSGRAVVVRGTDIDTDRIIPARYLRTVTFDNLGEHAFEDERRAGSHPFDDPRCQGAGILVVNKNFGCGSSREHAPQALARWGIRGFVGESFAEIFFGNCVAMGLPCMTASEADVARLMQAVEEDPSLELKIDVEAQTVAFASDSITATLPDGPRGQLVTGTWDALGQLLEAADEIESTAGKLPYVAGF